MRQGIMRAGQFMNQSAKRSTLQILLIGSKLFVALHAGLVMGLVFQNLYEFGTLALVFVVVAFSSVFMKIMKGMTFIWVGVFGLFLALIALVVRMYIHIAPGV